MSENCRQSIFGRYLSIHRSTEQSAEQLSWYTWWLETKTRRIRGQRVNDFLHQVCIYLQLKTHQVIEERKRMRECSSDNCQGPWKEDKRRTKGITVTSCVVTVQRPPVFLTVGECWCGSALIFLHRSVVSDVFPPHSRKQQNTVHRVPCRLRWQEMASLHRTLFRPGPH